MALTLEAEQRLTAIGLVQLFEDHRDDWKAAADRTYNFIREGFPDGSPIRQDDIAKALTPILEVNEILRKFLSSKKQRQKFWIAYFTDYIIDQVWEELGD